MSASPTAAPTQSSKRPLEDPSSPSAPNDQPDAKRPALDKIVKDEDEDEESKPATNDIPAESNGEVGNTESKNGVKPEDKDGQGDTVVSDAVPQPITTAGSDIPQSGGSISSLVHDETTWIHVRSVITSAEAATVIGKGGENVSVIRKMSNAKCTVSDYQKGAVERILTVSGVVDAVAKVCQHYLAVPTQLTMARLSV